jgi:hypothetical protein
MQLSKPYKTILLKGEYMLYNVTATTSILHFLFLFICSNLFILKSICCNNKYEFYIENIH